MWYSGTLAKQNFSALESELRRASWVESRDPANDTVNQFFQRSVAAAMTSAKSPVVALTPTRSQESHVASEEQHARLDDFKDEVTANSLEQLDPSSLNKTCDYYQFD